VEEGLALLFFFRDIGGSQRVGSEAFTTKITKDTKYSLYSDSCACLPYSTEPIWDWQITELKVTVGGGLS
jgi:hypothetical protein